MSNNLDGAMHNAATVNFSTKYIEAMIRGFVHRQRLNEQNQCIISEGTSAPYN